MGASRSGCVGLVVTFPASIWRFGSLALIAGLVSCGARTGLDAPDAQIDAGMDAGPPPPPPPLCVDVPVDDPRVRVDLEIPASLRVVDVMFLIDSTASMQDEIDSVRERLRDRVVPGVRELIPDAAFGVALFGEFPVAPHALAGDDVGPFLLRTPITTDVVRIETALARTPVWGNLDDPEAAIEGLFQVATGAGLEPFIEASVGCPSGGVGGACFRDDAFRIVMLVTDAPMHNGPPDVSPVSNYERVRPAPHTYLETVEATRALDLFVIGLAASDAGRPSAFQHLVALARDTESVDGAGDPIVFDIGGRGDRIGAGIVDAVRRVAEEVPLDVDATVEDRPGDALDALDVVRAIHARSADPASGIAGMDGSRFLGVRPGTRLTFELEIDASELPPSPARREFAARVIFRESGRSRIEVRDIVIVVPGDDGLGCEDE
ncbi:internalin [Sandaracinus amylolyticus]|uniref:Internalin n=1 Tax=Sandaracinus amylolyticus TaxID=927083 RepID=A0A0F6W771_9BACT|nr:internalin [Sandaracinus amylolyticus]